MSIKDIMRKHGYTGGKKGWFHGKIRRVTVDYREK